LPSKKERKVEKITTVKALLVYLNFSIYEDLYSCYVTPEVAKLYKKNRGNI